MLRACVFSSSSVSNEAKAAAYESIVLAILLFGGESWCLTEPLMQQLRVFHARCLRSMCRVTRTHVWTHHITSVELMQRLGLDAIDFYLSQSNDRSKVWEFPLRQWVCVGSVSDHTRVLG